MKKLAFTRILIALSLSLVFTTVVISCKDTSSNTGNAVSGTEYTSEMTKSDKKKYSDASGNVVYEVKYKPDGFKLRTPSSDLLWKVKLYDEKIKISDNEENLDPWEIKMVAATEAKLVKADAEIARTKYDASTGKQTINFEDGSSDFSKDGSYSPSFLVEAINAIPKDQQDLIISELKDKGY